MIITWSYSNTSRLISTGTSMANSPFVSSEISAAGITPIFVSASELFQA